MAQIGGRYHQTPATYTDGELVESLPTDVNGNLMVNIAAGETINIGTLALGTMNTLGTVSKLLAGSVAVVAGTGVITSGSIAVVAGTIASATVVGGSIAVTAATISAGTMQLSGTPNVGTISMISAGTVKNDGRPARDIKTYGTTFGGTAAGYGTLVGSAGAGTSIWINDISLINSKGGTLTCMVGFGTALQGSSVLLNGDFGPREGAVKTFPLAVNAGMTNNDLVAYVGAAGTIDVNVTYFVSA